MDDDDGIGETGLCWMVNGEKLPFEPAACGGRPWLEESVEWDGPAADAGPKPDEPPEAEPPKFIWL